MDVNGIYLVEKFFVISKGELENLTVQNICKRPNSCKYCPLLDKSNFIVNRFNNMKYHCKQNVCCQSSNLIYVLTCNVCQIQYVGQTKRKIMNRIWDHLNDIKRERDTTVARHFNNHGNQPDLKFNILEFIKCHPDSERSKSLRDKCEKAWMSRLNSWIPKGLNIMD